MILVTGGCGYIGLHVVRELQKRHRVRVLDIRPPPSTQALRGAEFRLGDIRDRATVDDALRGSGVRAVIHLAGLKSVAESMEDPGAYFDTNVTGSLVLLSAMAAAGVGTIVFSSSAAVYGTPIRLPVDESAEFRPANPYGESKAIVERMLPWFAQSAGLRFVSLRYFNAAGASSDGDIGECNWAVPNLLPTIMRALSQDGPPVQIFGSDYPTDDGTAVRDYVHVEDLAEAHVRAVEHLDAGGPSETLNLGTGTGTSVKRVIDEVERVSERRVPVVRVDRREGDPAAIWADVSRAQAILGWTARRGIQDIVASEWAWYSRQS